jgi:uncharacterized membrane protein
MAKTTASRHPIAWTFYSLRQSALFTERPRDSVRVMPNLHRIGLTDLRYALREGWQDFTACRSDAVMLCLVYPVAGILIAHVVMGFSVLPLVFPLVAGFALLGPLFATGLYELSRRREKGGTVDWAASFAPFSSPALGSILVMGFILLAVFAAWLVSAYLIYVVTLGPAAPISQAAFAHDVLHTPRGLAMTVLGVGVGAIFAFVVLTISSVAFPLLLDRDCGVEIAIRASVRAMALNGRTMLAWGAIVAFALALGSLPFLLGLAIIMPVLGHATWHLYRRLVA